MSDLHVMSAFESVESATVFGFEFDFTGCGVQIIILVIRVRENTLKILFAEVVKNRTFHKPFFYINNHTVRCFEILLQRPEQLNLNIVFLFDKGKQIISSAPKNNIARHHDERD